jgi:hypothetical protein
MEESFNKMIFLLKRRVGVNIGRYQCQDNNHSRFSLVLTITIAIAIRAERREKDQERLTTIFISTSYFTS